MSCLLTTQTPLLLLYEILIRPYEFLSCYLLTPDSLYCSIYRHELGPERFQKTPFFPVDSGSPLTLRTSGGYLFYQLTQGFSCPVHKDIRTLTTFPACKGCPIVSEDIWRTLTFPIHSEVTPVYKNIWKLLTFSACIGLTTVREDICRLLPLSTHSGLTPIYKDILKLFNFPAHTGITPVHKDIWRLFSFPFHTGLTPVHKSILRLLSF